MMYVYMNHRIKQKKPDGPVIVSQDEQTIVEANSFEITVGDQVIGYVVFDEKGLPACETHDVKAWLELNNSVVLRPIGKCIVTPLKPKPVAEPKKPNNVVEFKTKNLPRKKPK
jgi:hypothetical protein